MHWFTSNLKENKSNHKNVADKLTANLKHTAGISIQRIAGAIAPSGLKRLPSWDQHAIDDVHNTVGGVDIRGGHLGPGGSPARTAATSAPACTGGGVAAVGGRPCGRMIIQMN